MDVLAFPDMPGGLSNDFAVLYYALSLLDIPQGKLMKEPDIAFDFYVSLLLANHHHHPVPGTKFPYRRGHVICLSYHDGC